MVYIAERKLQQLVRQYTSCICESKQRVVREACPQPHRASVQYSFVAEAAQTGVTVHDLNLLPNDYVPEYWEEGEHRGEGAFAVYDEEGHVVHFEPICEVSHSSAAFVCMCDDDDFVAPIYEFLCELSTICAAPLSRWFRYA